jgi:hypothetical protein
MPITTNVVSSNPSQAMYTLCDKVNQWLVAGGWISPVSSTNKTDETHDVHVPKLILRRYKSKKSELYDTCILVTTKDYLSY